MFKIVRGNPTPEELAAAVAVVRARVMESSAREGGAVVAPQQRWSAPSRIAHGTLPVPGPRAWAHTYWPI
ncbi:acyl-CoA carboxylase subunit epsilon [Streptomyces sp. NPDC003860]